MPTYIMLARVTYQAKTNMAEARKRRDKLWEEFKAHGVKVTSYSTMGPYDVVSIIDAPSDEVALKFLMAAGATGNIESTTMRAWPSSEVDKIAPPS